MKDKIILVLSIIIILLCGFGVWKTAQSKNFLEDYQIAVQNNKAYESQIGLIKEQNNVFMFTVEQLRYTNDSTIKELDSLRKQLKIKDAKIKQMGKVKEKVFIHDTLNVYDTIFNDANFKLDTCIGDEWYSQCLHLEYPNNIESNIDINTDLNCFIYAKRETINPPCKTWLGRLFQRKHTVINVTVQENNPYADVKEVKFVKILDK